MRLNISFQNEIELHAEGVIIHFIENCPKTRCTNQLNRNMHPRLLTQFVKKSSSVDSLTGDASVLPVARVPLF